MITCTRIFTFDAGHRVLGHGSKCRHLHGHTYKAEVSCSAPKLDELGMVIDFAAVKTTVGNWIDDNWDHNLILHPEDPMWLLYDGLPLNQADHADSSVKHQALVGGHSKMIELPTRGDIFSRAPYRFTLHGESANPTAENLAAELLWQANNQLSRNASKIRCVSVRMWETPNCYADCFYNGDEIKLLLGALNG